MKQRLDALQRPNRLIMFEGADHSVIVYTALGCWLSLTFLPTEQTLSAVDTVGLRLVAGCVLAMVASFLWAQRAVACVMVVWIAWYFSMYLPGFSS